MNLKLLFAIIVAAVLMSACDLLNCTQADVSCLRIEIYDGSGNKAVLPDTLTVRACGTDSILVNRDYNANEILLPLSFHAPVDTFVLQHYGNGYWAEDTLYVRKTNDIYFESPDCPTVMMHTLLGITCTDVFVDSVKVVSNKVNFEEALHMKLFIQEHQ